MANTKAATPKLDPELKRRQEIDRKKEDRGPTQEVTGGPGSLDKQRNKKGCLT